MVSYSDDDYNEWYLETFTTNAELFAEKNDEAFEDYCRLRYMQRGTE